MKFLGILLFASLFIVGPASAKTGFTCGKTPVHWVHTAAALDSPYFEEGPSHGAIYLDDRFFAKYSVAVGKFVFTHECGHARGILNENGADAYAIRVAKRDGWATPELLSQLCTMLISYNKDYRRCTRFKAAWHR